MPRIFGILLCLFWAVGAQFPTALADDDAAAKTFATDPEASNLYIYRKANVWGSSIPFQVFVDGNPIGALGNKKYRVIKVPPGQHVIYVLAYENQKSLTIETTAGKNYYLKVSVKVGLVSPRVKLKEVPERKAQKDILKLKPAKTFDLNDEQ
jgi:hypothetical protein